MRQGGKYKVDNAIIMAAGKSSRFAPLSHEVHKALLKVNGEVLIERQIQQLHASGIDRITIVTGYRKQDFNYLKAKLCVDIVENDDYFRYNNPSSLLRVADRLSNTYICSCDNYFVENVFDPYVVKSYYAAVYYPGKSSEWGIVCDAAGRIVGIDHSPVNMWCMMGHAFFDEIFSKTFVELLQSNRDNEDCLEHLWESLLEKNLDVLDIDMKKYPAGSIKEFDSLEELRFFDDSYANCSGSKILHNIATTLNCREDAVSNVSVVDDSMEKYSFVFDACGGSYIYRELPFGEFTINKTERS